jgi:hypothetical protein
MYEARGESRQAAACYRNMREVRPPGLRATKTRPRKPNLPALFADLDRSIADRVPDVVLQTIELPEGTKPGAPTNPAQAAWAFPSIGMSRLRGEGDHA